MLLNYSRKICLTKRANGKTFWFDNLDLKCLEIDMNCVPILQETGMGLDGRYLAVKCVTERTRIEHVANVH